MTNCSRDHYPLFSGYCGGEQRGSTTTPQSLREDNDDDDGYTTFPAYYLASTHIAQNLAHCFLVYHPIESHPSRVSIPGEEQEVAGKEEEEEKRFFAPTIVNLFASPPLATPPVDQAADSEERTEHMETFSRLIAEECEQVKKIERIVAVSDVVEGSFIRTCHNNVCMKELRAVLRIPERINKGEGKVGGGGKDHHHEALLESLTRIIPAFACQLPMFGFDVANLAEAAGGDRATVQFHSSGGGGREADFVHSRLIGVCATLLSLQMGRGEPEPAAAVDDIGGALLEYPLGHGEVHHARQDVVYRARRAALEDFAEARRVFRRRYGGQLL